MQGLPDTGFVKDGEVDAALRRLIAIARSDTGQARRVANFLLAWWDGDSWGHFPIADLFGLDRAVAADISRIIVFLAQTECAIYPDAWGARDAMAELVERWRPESD